MEEMENAFVKFWFENNILFSEFQKGTELTLDSARQSIEMREKISQGQKQYWFYDITNMKGIDKEARDYVDKHGQELLFACATLVNSHVTKFMFNTFLKLKSPKIPFQVFTNKEEAIKWLEEIKAKNEQNNF